MATVTVMGAGSWGTTVAAIAADAGNAVMLWARQPEVAERMQISRENFEYLPGFSLPDNITVTSDTHEALDTVDIVILGVPSQSLRSNLQQWMSQIPQNAVIVSLSKGIEQGTGLRMSEVIEQESGIARERITVLSGPNLAGELALKQPAAAAIAGTNEENARTVQQALFTEYFRPYTNSDVIGTEIGGACKNVIALACGMAAGLNYGTNTLSAVIARGLAEITDLGMALGASPATFAGLSGLGDLSATCTSPLSRNRSFGVALGRGNNLEEAALATQGQVAEGVASSLSIHELARKNNVCMPISEAVMDICHRGASVQELARALTQLPVGKE